MAAGDRSWAEELWSKWEQMTALVPQEERAPVEAWIRREREVFPAGMRWKDAGPVEWLEELVLDEGCGLKKMAGRMLYAAWRLGEGCMQGERHRRAYLHRHVSTEDRLRLCRRIGYSVEEIMEDSVLACQDGGSRSAVHTFGVIMEKLYVKYPYEQLTAYLDGRYAGGSLPEAGTEEDRWRLWADGELLHMFLKAHDPRSDIYMEGFLACLQKLPVINMEELPLRLAQRRSAGISDDQTLQRTGGYGISFRMDPESGVRRAGGSCDPGPQRGSGPGAVVHYRRQRTGPVDEGPV